MEVSQTIETKDIFPHRKDNVYLMKTFLLAIRYLLIPAKSRREKIYHTLRILLLVWRLYGFGVVLTQIRRTFRFYISQEIREGVFEQASYNYQVWLRQNELDKRQIKAQVEAAKKFSYQPVITFITSVGNCDVSALRHTLNSVLAQSYSKWQFCLVDVSANSAIALLLDEFAGKDARVQVIHLPENLGISGNTNVAIKNADGEFVMLLNQHDMVAPDLLYHVVEALNKNKNLDVIYFDEDKIATNGIDRFDPWFKPSRWSPDLLLSTNYLAHAVIRKQSLIDIGAFDPSMDGAYEWDVVFRLVEKIQPAYIYHLPKVLYHVRIKSDSKDGENNADSLVTMAQERSIEAHITRTGKAHAQVSVSGSGIVRVFWEHSQARVAIIIPTKNNLSILRACLDSIFQKTTYPNFEIILVDNRSSDKEVFEYYNQLTTRPDVRVLSYDHPFNFHKINNWAANQTDADVIVFLNNDTEVIASDWLEELVGWVSRPEVGIVGAKLLRPNGKIQHAGMIIGMMGHASHIFEDCDDHVHTHFGSVDWYRDYMSVTGACIAIRRNIFEALKGFDESYIVGYGDIDLCLRAIEAGYRVVYTPFAVLLHHEGGTRGLNLPPSDVLRASIKMFRQVELGDGYFNPNLSYSTRQPVVSHMLEEPRGERLVRIMREFGLIGGGLGTEEWQKFLLSIPSDILAFQEPQAIPPSNTLHSILIVTHELTRSGAPIILYMLAKHLKSQGLQIYVVAPVDGPLKNDYLEQSIPVEIVPRLLEDARVSVAYFDKAQVILCNTILTWRIVHAARAFAKQCLWWVHESNFGVTLAKENIAIAKAFDAAALVVFPSETTKNQYHQFSHINNFVSVITGFDVDTSEPQPATGLMPGAFNLICVATIEARKGQDILLKALSQLPKDIANEVHCFLIGRTNIDARFALEIYWRSLWQKNVHLMGELPNRVVRQYLYQADIFVMPSRDEALPLALLEAMAMGKTIVASNAGGIPEVIHSGENGYIFQIEDAKKLAEYLEYLYRNPGMRQQLAYRAKQDYETNHSLDIFAKNMLYYIHQLLQTSGL